MHTPVDALCCCKPAQPAHRAEQVCHRALPRVPGETSRDRPSLDLVANSKGEESKDGLALGKAEAQGAEPEASVQMHLVPEVPLRALAEEK